MYGCGFCCVFFLSSRRLHTRCALVTGVQTCALPISTAKRNGFSVLGPEVTVTGDIEADSDLHIDGTVAGDLACASLIQTERGRITGAVRARSARIAGTIERSEEHTSELQSLMRISYAVFCLTKQIAPNLILKPHTYNY